MITPNSAATPASAMKPTALATDRLCPSSQSSQKPPTSANGSVAMISSASSTRRKVRYSSTKMISSVARHDDLQPLRSRARGTRTGPTTRSSSRAAASPRSATARCISLHRGRAGRGRGCRRRPSRTSRAFSLRSIGGPSAMRDVGDVAQHDLRAALGDDRQRAQLLERVAHFARIAHVDREALQALDRLADVLAADRRGDHRLHVGDVEAVARGRVAVDRRRRCSARRSAARRAPR